MNSKIIAISGDASFRKFYRIDTNKKSKIVVYSNKDKYQNLVAYSAINKFLRDNKILAPKLFEHNYNKGIIVIEDFGDLSFYKVLIKKKNKLLIYKNLVDFLLKIQKIKPKFKIKNIINKTHQVNKYSQKYLQKEVDLFFKWYLPLILSKKKALKVEKKAKNILSQLCRKLFFPNSCFVHRDYHVENLMKIKKKIGVIDSQDALIGNPAYDLVSLVDDVRIKTSSKLKSQICKYYLKKTKKISRIKGEKFLEDFDILSVQRSLKIIGIFSRLFKRDKKKRYVKFIPYTWKLLEKRMSSKIFFELRKIFENNISKRMRSKIIH